MGRHSNKVRFDSTTWATLRTLREAGGEDAACILNMVMTENQMKPEEALHKVRTAIAMLARHAYVHLYYTRYGKSQGTVPLRSDDIEQALDWDQNFMWDGRDRLWHWKSVIDPGARLEVVLAELGREVLDG